MTSRTEIAERARELGWTLHIDRAFSATFTHRAKVDDPRFLKVAELGGWTPTNVIVVFFSSQGSVLDASLSTPKQQAALDGRHVGKEAHTEGKGRKQQVLSWLEWGGD